MLKVRFNFKVKFIQNVHDLLGQVLVQKPCWEKKKQKPITHLPMKYSYLELRLSNTVDKKVLEHMVFTIIVARCTLIYNVLS